MKKRLLALCLSLSLCLSLLPATLAEGEAPRTYDEAVELLNSGTGHVNRKIFDTPECTVFFYDRGGFMNAPTGALSVIYKAGSALGEGTVIDLPHVSSRWLYRGAPNTVALSEDQKIFTYTYFFLEPYGAPTSDPEVTYLAYMEPGTYTYTVDLAAGTTTDSYTPLDYATALDQLTRAEGYLIDRQLDTPNSTVVLRHKAGTWWVAEAGKDLPIDDYEMYLVLKGETGENTVHRLLLPSTVYNKGYGYAPTDRAPDAMDVSSDGFTLRYTYSFDAPLANGDTVYHEAGTYEYNVDMTTGELTAVNFQPAGAPTQSGGFSDVSAGDWFAPYVDAVREKGVMIGTSDTAFSPRSNLTQAECLTLALRLYDLMRGTDHVVQKAPEDWGKMTLTLSDGTVFEGYGYQSEDNVFSWWSGRNGYKGVKAEVPGWSYEDMEAGAKAQRIWMDAHPEICKHDAPATLTLNGVTYQGTANCWMPVGPFVFMFQPEPGKTVEVNTVLHHAVYREAGPDRWWRDTAYTIVQRGLENIFDPVEFTDYPADRGFFARLIAAACEGHLEKLNTVEAIPDLPREKNNTAADAYREAAYALYEAGILTGVDDRGSFAADASLTRAEAAAMVARAMDAGLRIHSQSQ